MNHFKTASKFLSNRSAAVSAIVQLLIFIKCIEPFYVIRGHSFLTDKFTKTPANIKLFTKHMTQICRCQRHGRQRPNTRAPEGRFHAREPPKQVSCARNRAIHARGTFFTNGTHPHTCFFLLLRK